MARLVACRLSPADALAGIARAAARPGRTRVLLSGGLDPALSLPLAERLAGLGLDPDPLPPDPLGIEDLLGRTDEDLALIIVQTPTVFGGGRALGGLAAICAEMEITLAAWIAEPRCLARPGCAGVPGAGVIGLDFGGGTLLAADRARCGLLPGAGDPAGGALPDDWVAEAAAIESMAETLAARLRGRRGVRVVGSALFHQVMVHLGDETDARTLVTRLEEPGRPLVQAAADLFPGWPELRPVLIASVGPDTTAQGITALAAALG
jgi:glycine dehydrogenase subunit 1